MTFCISQASFQHFRLDFDYSMVVQHRMQKIQIPRTLIEVIRLLDRTLCAMEQFHPIWTKELIFKTEEFDYNNLNLRVR